MRAHRLWLAVLAASCISCRPTAPPAPPSPPPSTEWREELVHQHNLYRLEHGRPPLVELAALTLAAQRHAAWMAQVDRLTHDGVAPNRSPGDRAQNAGYPSRYVGENIAMGYSSIHAVMRGWTGSTGHRRNMLDDYRHIGVGRAWSARGRVYWCAVFGRAPAPAESMDNYDEIPGGG